MGDFFPSEFAVPKNAPHDAGFIMGGHALEGLMEFAQAIRDEINVIMDGTIQKACPGSDIRMKISSGCRTKAHNDFVKGSKTSYHLLGMAIDFKFLYPDGVRRSSKVEYQAIQNALKNLCIQGGVYYMNTPYWHVDMRAKKWRGTMPKGVTA